MVRTFLGRISTTVAVLGIAVFATVLTPGLAVAHEGHVHKIMGTVTMAAADHVMVKTIDAKTKAEKTVTIVINDKTKVVKGTTAATVADIKDGDRVVVDVGAAKEPLTAREIKLGSAQTAAKPASTDAAHAKHSPSAH